jgi:hypothetical protein
MTMITGRPSLALALTFLLLPLLLSKDRFDEGSVSFDEYGNGSGKEGIYHEASVLSDSAVVDDDVAESDGNRSVDDIDDDEIEDRSKPKVFEFSGHTLVSLISLSLSSLLPRLLLPQELETSSHQMQRENWILMTSLLLLCNPFQRWRTITTTTRAMRRSSRLRSRSLMSTATALRATSIPTLPRKRSRSPPSRPSLLLLLPRLFLQRPFRRRLLFLRGRSQSLPKQLLSHCLHKL